MPTSTAGADHDPAVGAREAGRGRRGAGITVLVGLLVVLIVLAATHGGRLSSDPTAAPVPAAPQVGDCIQEDPYDRGGTVVFHARWFWRTFRDAGVGWSRWSPWGGRVGA